MDQSQQVLNITGSRCITLAQNKQKLNNKTDFIPNDFLSNTFVEAVFIRHDTTITFERPVEDMKEFLLIFMSIFVMTG